MAFRLYPFSGFPATVSRTFPYTTLTSTNFFAIDGLGVEASLGANAEHHYVWHVPASLPVGTPKLELNVMANAIGGDAKINPKWKSVPYEETFDLLSSSLNAEGTQTITWAAGDADVMKQLKVDLDADTVVVDEFIMMAIVYETSGWTLASRSGWFPAIIWE